ncbi:MAG: D-aminoacylase, partial [Acidobacteria bacterium]|nr:D-aminoacylase [Acidobacteriota bacterium]
MVRGFLLFVSLGLAAQNPEFDIRISGGRVIDGAGNPWYIGDVGITGDAIVYVGPPTTRAAKIVLDARGRYVTPGFIDTHSHGRRGVFDVPSA